MAALALLVISSQPLTVVQLDTMEITHDNINFLSSLLDSKGDTMTYRIVIRAGGIPWAEMNHASFIGQAGGLNLPHHLIFSIDALALIKAWETAYGLDYFLYRQCIKDACRAKLEALANDSRFDVAISNSVEQFLADEEYEQSDIILPIDDDDIYLPPVFEVIDEPFMQDGINLVAWDRTTVFHGTERTEVAPHPYLDTNNWAIHGSYLQTFPASAQLEMLSKHQKAHTEVGKRLGVIPRIANVIGPDFFKENNPYAPLKHPSVIDLHGHKLSLYYLHSGSISFLAHKMGKPDSVIATLRNLPLHPLFTEDAYQRLQKAAVAS
jgi:hypothetical protein